MYNNYGFNPYYQPQKYTGGNQQIEQPIQQPMMNNMIQTRPILNGKSVDSIDVVRAMDIPLDGSISYFPLTDGSAIVTKQLQNDGTSKTIIFKPVTEEQLGSKYVTPETLEKLKEEFRELKKELEEIQTKLKNEGE